MLIILEAYNRELYNINLSFIINKSLFILIIITSLANILIKIKILRFKRIYFYKNIIKKKNLH